MVTVDDLTISLTIKETSKLGKLQKQLNTLVGTKGEKEVTVSLDQSVVNDISYIKKRVMFIAPTQIPGKAQPFAMSETARILSTQLGENIRAYAEKLVPKRQDVLKATMKEFGVENRDELIDALEDRIRDWQLRLEDIQRRNWVSDGAQKFLVRIDDLVKRVKLPVGWAKDLMTNIDKSIGERNKEVAELLQKLGFNVKPEQWVARIKKEKLTVMFGSEGRDFIKQNMSKIQKAFNINTKELQNRINLLTIQAEKWEGGTVGALEKLAKEFKIPLEDLWNITDKEVAKSEELRAISALLTIITNIARKRGEPTAIPLGMQKSQIIAMKEIHFGDISKLSEELQKQVRKQIEEKFGTKIKDIFEKYRIDFLITNIQNSLEKIEVIFGKEIAESLKNFDSAFIEQKQILSETNKGQFRIYEALVGNKRLIGLATQVLTSFTNLFPEILTKRMDLATQTLNAEIREKLTDLEKEKLQEEAEEFISEENIVSRFEEMFKDFGGVVDPKIILETLLKELKVATNERLQIINILKAKRLLTKKESEPPQENLPGGS